MITWIVCQALRMAAEACYSLYYDAPVGTRSEAQAYDALFALNRAADELEDSCSNT